MPMEARENGIQNTRKDLGPEVWYLFCWNQVGGVMSRIQSECKGSVEEKLRPYMLITEKLENLDQKKEERKTHVILPTYRPNYF